MSKIDLVKLRDAPKFLTVTEAALILRVHKMTIYRLIYSGQLKVVKGGGGYKIYQDSFDEYLRDHTIGPDNE